MLEKLNLRRNYFTDEVVAAFANALANNISLRELDLSSNHDITAMGWVAFSAVLRNPNSALERLGLRCNNINDNVMITFAHTLANNSRLRDIFLDMHLWLGITLTGQAS